MLRNVLKLSFAFIFSISLLMSNGLVHAIGTWTNGVVSSNNKAFTPESAFGGGNYAITYTTQKPDSSVAVYLSIVSKAGVKLASDIPVSESSGIAFDPIVVWNGTNFGIFWYQGFTVKYAQFNKSGVVVTHETSLTASGEGAFVSAVWNPNSNAYGVTWYGSATNTPYEGARFAKFNRLGVRTSAVVVLSSANDGNYYKPFIATSGNGYAVAWDSRRNCNNITNCPQVFMARVNNLGQKVGNDFAVTSSDSDRAQALVWNGNSYAIFSIGFNGVNLNLVLNNNTIINNNTLAGGFIDPQNIKTEWNNGQYLLSFEDRITGNADIYVAKYRDNGSLIEPFYQVTTDTLPDYYASTVAFSSSTSLFVAYNTHLYETDQTISYALNQNFVTKPPKIIVGAKLSAYNPPLKAQCNIRVPAQYSTIQAGISAANNGDTVCVAPGTYNESVTIDKSIRLSGSGAGRSVINGQDSFGTVVIHANNVSLEGFLINGIGSGHYDPAVFLWNSDSNVTVQYNRIVAGNGGMAIRSEVGQNHHIFQNNILIGNNSSQVVYVNGDSMNFLNNTFLGTVNRLSGDGTADTGLILVVDVSTNCLINRNVFSSTGNIQEIVHSYYQSNEISENNLNSDTFSLLTSTPVKVRAGNSGPTNAENNWWGDLNPSDNIQGDIDFSPFALAPYPEN